MKSAPILGDTGASQQAGKDLTVSLVTEAEELARLEPPWSRLGQRMQDATPFSSFEWATLWWREFGPPAGLARGRGRNPFRRGLYVVAGRQGPSVAWIAPFVRVEFKSAGVRFRCLEFLTAPDAGRHDLLLDPEQGDQVESLVSFLLERRSDWDCLDLRHIPHDSSTPQLLIGAARRAGLQARVRPDRPRLVVPIHSDWETMLRGKSKTAREVFRNQANRLQRTGAAIRVLPDPSSEPGLVERMSQVEASKHVKGAPTLRLLPRHEGFYDALFRSLGPQQKLYAALLELDGCLLAYEWGFRTADSILPYNKAYLPEYGRLSPGTMLVPAAIDFGHRQGCREYDFSRGEQSYKRRWATESRASFRVEVWAPRTRSRMARLAFLRARPLALRTLSALRIKYTPAWEL